MKFILNITFIEVCTVRMR